MYLLLNKRKTKFLDDKLITLTKACFAATIKINLYEKWRSAHPPHIGQPWPPVYTLLYFDISPVIFVIWTI